MRSYFHAHLVTTFFILLIKVSFSFICLTKGYWIAICWVGEVWPGLNGDYWTLSREFLEDHSHPDCVDKDHQKCCREFYPYKSAPYLAPGESKGARGSAVDCINMDPSQQCPDFLPPGYTRKSKRFYAGGVEDGLKPELNFDCFYIVNDAENKFSDAGSSDSDIYQSLVTPANFS